MNLSEETLALIKGLRKDVTTQGLSTTTGLQFYYLEPKAKNIYPVFYPLLASTPRVNPTFNGMKVGGPGVNWKAIVGIDSGGYPGISEGNRNAFMNMTTRSYFAGYKYLGKDSTVSFQAQSQGMGFDDNLALAQLGMLNALLNDEERMLAYGNSGPANVGGNGYALGTTGTPVLTQSNVAGGNVAASAQNYVYAVALTPWGATMAGTTGVKLPFQRTNADASLDIINGGTGVISAVSNSVVTDSSHKSITVTVPYSVGAVAYAFYLNQAAAATSAARFVGTSPYPSFIILKEQTTTQLANAVDANTSLGLATDNSYNLLDFDGITTWGFGTSGSAQPAYLKDLGGAGFTSNGDGSIAEFEAVADYLWLNYKTSIDKVYAGGALIQSISKAIMTAAAGPGAQRMMFQSNDAGQLVGGTKVATYRWKYSNTALPKVVDVVAHPWLPDGMVLFDITSNPYPAAGDAIPAVRRIVSLEDHFSILWPKRRLSHEAGVYTFQTLEHYLPFSMGILTGCANKVN